MSLVTTAGIKFDGLGASGSNENVQNPAGMRFSANGKRIFIISHNDASAGITQYSFTNAFDTSSFTADGYLNINTGISPANDEPRGVAFNANGLKLYIGNDNLSLIHN